MEVVSIFNLAALLMTTAAVFGWINHRWFRLPHTIGLVVIALAASIVLLVLDAAVTNLGLRATVRGLVTDLEFEDTLMKALLGFLLFAGALHVDLDALLSRWRAISMLATAGIVVSTVVVAALTYVGFAAVGVPLGWAYCLVFGALISPTDPVAVLGVLRHVRVPPTLEAKIAGESLFNDGVGIVLFTVLVAVASSADAVTAGSILRLLTLETVGGVALGLGAGYGAYRVMRGIDDASLEVLITLALVMGTYAVALALHMSGPLAVVVAGLFIGNHGKRFAMSERTSRHIDTFWSLVDEILNSLLFLALGFEVMAIMMTWPLAGAGLMAVPIVLLARVIAVSLPITLLGLRREFVRGAIPVLTWGGLRGGISVALALSLPAGPERSVILATTYVVVVFSIVVQGLTVERVVRASVLERRPS